MFIFRYRKQFTYRRQSVPGRLVSRPVEKNNCLLTNKRIHLLLERLFHELQLSMWTLLLSALVRTLLRQWLNLSRMERDLQAFSWGENTYLFTIGGRNSLSYRTEAGISSSRMIKITSIIVEIITVCLQIISCTAITPIIDSNCDGGWGWGNGPTAMVAQRNSVVGSVSKQCSVSVHLL